MQTYGCFLLYLFFISVAEAIEETTTEAEVNGAGSAGYCYRQTSKTKVISQYYSVACVTHKRTCWWFFCHEKTIYKICKKSRQIPNTIYIYSRYCCPGYIENGTTCAIGCQEGKFGSDCSSACNCNSLQNAHPNCKKDTGQCICTAGWKGSNCTERCPDGYFGDGCLNACMCRNNGTCNTTDGSCNCTFPGYTGEHCDELCEDGRYGYNCFNVCHCNENQSCDHRTGKCVCKAGLTGENCTSACSNYTYGADCNKKCNCNLEWTKQCDPVNGTCECRPGYIGPFCEDSCPTGMFGYGCSSKCNCSSTEYCRPSDGKCLRFCFCNKAGTENCVQDSADCTCTDRVKRGSPQQEQCLRNSINSANKNNDAEYVLNNCACRHQNDSLCVPKNSTCECKVGYYGDWCQECPDRYYGQNCESECQCKNNATCNKINGTCTCIDEWTGDYCDEDVEKTKLKKSGTDNLAAIAGGVSGVVVVLSVIVVAVIVTYSRQKSTEKKSKPKFVNNAMYTAEQKDDDETTQTNTAKTFSNKAFQNEDELYNVLNQNDYDSDNKTTSTLNTYGHLNIAINSATGDDAYDVMTHNQKLDSGNDTYDHMKSINDTYDSMKKPI